MEVVNTARPLRAAKPAVGIAMIVVLLGTPQANAGDDKDRKRRKDPIPCAELATRYQAKDVVITSSTVVPEVTTGGNAAPEHCDVRGTISDNIKFALFLPAAWNERFQMVGNGGKAGSISLGDMRTALRLGYASSSTDTGHDNAIPAESGSGFGNDALFGKEREIDFGWRAVHLTALVSKDVIAAHYPKKLRYSYWNGCSTGGRQGLMEAQRFPDDFDGYLVGAPVYDYTGQQMSAPAMLRPLYSRIPPLSPTDGPVISSTKRDMIGNVIYNGLGEFKGCDALDGVVDGQIRNPLKCDFDPARHIPICSETSGSTCLTPNELAALQEIYAGKEPFVPGMPRGSENIPGGWSSWIVPNSPTGTPLLHNVIADAFEWLMFDPDRPGFNYLTEWDWNVHPFQMEGAKQIYNATDPNLFDILLRGKKIIMYHGWGDPGANPIRSIRYRESVVDSLARKLHLGQKLRFIAENATDQFLKLYLVPGMAHCGGGVGHSTVDWLSPLVDWVEHRTAPRGIIGSRGTSTRPHCPYPQEAVWTGAGSTDDAANFVCKRDRARDH
jgi:feruloyl esterase